MRSQLNLTGKLYIQYALNKLLDIKAQFCPTNNNCSWDNNTKKDINDAISFISTALSYFEPDGNHLKTNKGLNFYDKVTSAVNDIYSYLSNLSYGSDIDLTLYYLMKVHTNWLLLPEMTHMNLVLVRFLIVNNYLIMQIQN